MQLAVTLQIAYLNKCFDHFGAVYGADQLVYNIHGITDLASHARRFGPVHNFSGFPFENHLQSIKKLVRKPKFPLEQVIRRLTEQMNVMARPPGLVESYCKREHHRGPLPQNIGFCAQFDRYHSPDFVLTVNRPDNAIATGDGDTYIIKNIIVHDVQQFSN